MKRTSEKCEKLNVIIFGGSGYLGSHVADTLSETGFRVKVFDRKKAPYLKPDQEMIVGDTLVKMLLWRPYGNVCRVIVSDLLLAKDPFSVTVYDEKNNI